MRRARLVLGLLSLALWACSVPTITTPPSPPGCAVNNGGCDANASCTEEGGSVVCHCPAGYSGTGLTCTDVDECAASAATCDAHASCTNIPGSFTCSCQPGYEGDGQHCTDVNECENHTATCDTHATCANTDGAYECHCAQGYTGDGKQCTDVDECANLTATCDAHATCLNKAGSYECHCADGYPGDGQHCADIDECANLTAACDALGSCVNTDGSYECSCPAGYVAPDHQCVRPFSSLSAGPQASCVIRANGTLWCWGQNKDGLLGDGRTTEAAGPAQVGTDTDWRQVTARMSNSFCALKTDGTLWCWGNNSNGQLGDGTTTSRNRLEQVGTDTDWSLLESAYSYSAFCALKTNGSLWCWGFNFAGLNARIPVQIGTDIDWATLSHGGSHACALKADGSLWCWGQNGYRQLGNGTNVASDKPLHIGSDTDWAALAMGDNHSCAVKTDGTLWCWGDNSSGQLGLGDVTRREIPTRVGTDADWNLLAAGMKHTCAIKTDGSLWCWGQNSNGQLGTGAASDTPQLSPAPVPGGHTWLSVAPAKDHTCGTTEAGELLCWGLNDKGQIGLGLSMRTAKPRAGAGATDDWTSLQLSGNAGCATKANGSTWCWGKSMWPGEATTIDTQWPLPVQQAGSGNQYALGNDYQGGYLCWVTPDHALWCGGRNNYGEVGNGATRQSSAPFAQVGTDTDWVTVKSSAGTTCATKQDGSLWCWGQANNKTTPTQVDTSLTWDVFAPGGEFVCATKQDHTLWCFGSNALGQLGDGTTVASTTPHQVGTATNWSTVTAGGSHACAVNQSGEAWCWGRGDSGQLGDAGSGTRYIQVAPVKVRGMPQWQSLAIGTSENAATCGLRTDKTLWCWGVNTVGQLGQLVTSGFEATPLQVGTDADWVAVSSGAQSTCALKESGAVWCWGDDSNGAFGDDAAYRYNPSVIAQ